MIIDACLLCMQRRAHGVLKSLSALDYKADGEHPPF